MNRVWKKFLMKIGKAIAVVAYLLTVTLGVGIIATYVGYNGEIAMVISVFVAIVAPIVVMMVRDEYQDSKWQVEQENREMMRNIKGDN
tara:strand:+ start:181 stop:444 length:264 start_codon:yes stop_codon:yes gene_type:complete